MESLKLQAIKLRGAGKTYSEIQNALEIRVPKSTLSYWCKDVSLSHKKQERIRKLILNNSKKGLKSALLVNRTNRKKYLESIIDRNKHLKFALKNKDTAKIVLAVLYLGEGGKNRKGSLLFGNSDPFIIGLFLHLLRYCYDIDESKFRCTIQCRADHNIKKLEQFWSQITKISSSQFYKARIDPRTIGKKSRKENYKGVCRIDYFSADLFLELMSISKIIYKGP